MELQGTQDTSRERGTIVQNTQWWLQKADRGRYTTFDTLLLTFAAPYLSIVERLKEGKSELCGAEDEVMIHQVRTLTTLQGEIEWERTMLKRRRKTLAVCQCCNEMIHGKKR